MIALKLQVTGNEKNGKKTGKTAARCLDAADRDELRAPDKAGVHEFVKQHQLAEAMAGKDRSDNDKQTPLTTPAQALEVV